MKQATGKTKELAKHGRKGDTEVVHVNALEKALLKALGGAGTKNPRTGKREYYDASDADSFADSGMDRFGGTGDQDFSSYSEGEARETGFYDGGNQGTGGTTPYSQFASPQQMINLDQQMPGAPTNPFSGQGQRTGGLGSIIESIIASNKPSVLAPTARMSYELAKGLGSFVGKPINDMFGGNALPETPQFTGGAMGGEGRNDALSAAVGVQPAVQQSPAFMRPPEVELPASLGLPTGLSDLQKRTMIATYGSQGAQGQYRTPEAMRAYGNLLARALIGDNNQLVGNETGTLPIEDQYLRQAFGLNKPNSASALLEALRPYWSA